MITQIISPTQTQVITNLLKEGKLVALPTDTVYGLACIANSEEAIHNLRVAKNRPDEKAFAYVVNSLEKIEAVCQLSDRDRELINKHLPGPITFIFNKKSNDVIVNESQLDTLAIRIPDHPLLLEVLAQMEIGIYLPSANISGQSPATDSGEVLNQLNQRIDAIVEGQSFNQIASTIIDATGSTLKLLREGPIPLSAFTGEAHER